MITNKAMLDSIIVKIKSVTTYCISRFTARILYVLQSKDLLVVEVEEVVNEEPPPLVDVIVSLVGVGVGLSTKTRQNKFKIRTRKRFKQ